MLASTAHQNKKVDKPRPLTQRASSTIINNILLIGNIAITNKMNQHQFEYPEQQLPQQNYYVDNNQQQQFEQVRYINLLSSGEVKNLVCFRKQVSSTYLY
jgi:hypothetical protein